MDSGFGKTAVGRYLVVYKDGVRSKATLNTGVSGKNYFNSDQGYNYILKYLKYPKEDRGVTLGPGELIWWR